MGSEHSSMAERDVAKPPLDAETVESYRNKVIILTTDKYWQEYIQPDIIYVYDVYSVI